MKTPANYSDNLKNNIITTAMLEAALLSVNKRAKNYRDKEREYRHSHGFYSDRNAASMATKKEVFYQKEELLLSMMEPICIHAEFAGY